MADCIFCGIAGKSIPAKLIHEGNQVVAFKDTEPQVPIHLLVIPKRHIADLKELTEQDAALAGHLLLVAQHLGAEYDTKGHGFRVVANSGPQAEIPHLHLHVLGGQPTLGPLTGGE
ncbi:HIT domain-containing protein [Patescibacteria group bacterium]|nr:HIT domain-containing protein [Patescibacteria group bacterium]